MKLIPTRAPASLLLIISYLGFISLGLPDTLIGVAWPSIRESFRLSQEDLGLVFLGAGSGYFLSSFFTGRLLQWLTVGALLAASTGLVALSQAGFALAPLWLAFGVAALLHGLGSGAIDAGLNHYVAHHFSARHMTWLHACYSLGATFGPLIMTGALISHGSWRTGYATVAGIMLVLSLLFAATRRHWSDGVDAADAAPTGKSSMRETLSHPAVLLQVFFFFVYTGLEVTVGQWSFTLLTESRGLPAREAGLWVTIYWGSIAVGRVLLGFIVERFGPDRLVRLSTLLAILGAGCIALGGSQLVALAGLALTGLALAPIYPCLMSRTPARLGGNLAAHAIGFQVSAAMLGAAVLPAGSGLLAPFSLEYVAWVAVATAVLLLALHEVILRIPDAEPVQPSK